MSIGIYSNSGNDVRLLKDQLDLNGTAKVLTGTDDPRSVAKDAPQGSLYLQTGSSGGKIFKKLDAGSSTNWTEVGSGAGGINYILNPDAEAGTTGWATYADAAATTPVDGTGGSPTVTFTTSASSPLRGNNSFLITKDAANRQGEGASYNFSIDQADRASVIAIEFDYAVASGTFAAGDSSDIRVFIYDVTNAQLITPVANTVQSNTQSKFKGLFQSASNSSSYRLIFHCATTSASAYTFKIDNVRVGPQQVVYASPITDTVAFTPTGSWSTNTTYSGVYQRVGDTAHITVLVTTSGAPTVATLTINNPTGLVTDTTKLLTSTNDQTALGTALIFDNGGAGSYPGAAVQFNSTTSVRVLVGNASATYVTGTVVTDGLPMAFGAGDSVVVSYKLPIVGWGTSVQVSSDAETRVVAARYSTAAGQVIPDNTDTVLDAATREFDTHAAVTTGSNWRFTAPVAGYYRVGVCAAFDANGGGTRAATIRKNGVAHSTVDSQLSFGSGQTDVVQGSALIYLNPAEYVDVTVFQNTGGIKGMLTDATFNFISVDRVAGPAAIAANELIACHGVLTADQTVASGATDIVVFNNKSTNGGFDTHGELNTSTGRFTAPVSGTYMISPVIIANATVANWSVIIYKNGSAIKALGRDDATSLFQMSGTVLQRLVPGDIVDVRVTKSGGGSVVVNGTSDSLASTVSIHRVGF